MGKLALLDLLTHVRNVFSGLVLAGTLLRMEQPPTVVVVDRRGRCFDLNLTSSPAVSKLQRTREELILETEFGCFTLPNFIGSRCLPPFFGETTCADGRCLPVSHLLLGLVLRFETNQHILLHVSNQSEKQMLWCCCISSVNLSSPHQENQTTLCVHDA